jgi:hypothetical protein
VAAAGTTATAAVAAAITVVAVCPWLRRCSYLHSFRLLLLSHLLAFLILSSAVVLQYLFKSRTKNKYSIQQDEMYAGGHKEMSSILADQ